MVYRIGGGLFFILLGAQMLGVEAISGSGLGILGLITGIALLAGL